MITSLVATLDLILFLTDVSLHPILRNVTLTLTTANWNVSNALLFSDKSTEEHSRHLTFNFPLCKLYTNSLMSSLNTRQGWQFGSTQAELMTFQSNRTLTVQLANTFPIFVKT
ncbi:hypothetical protein CPB84DRAFT_1793647 [Gymnopilus junonius]|uniref:Uncharacterized protein n=1 Tax=Gymnopilus junonius TaxID=109634 RepID=A0A9P5NCC0_GYMJU|nr:hypothetical protein CPB84DRAFT_1793647 [Gymnopilus junonius]